MGDDDDDDDDTNDDDDAVGDRGWYVLMGFCGYLLRVW